MNVCHNDDDRPDPSGTATIAEWRGCHDASLGEWRCGSAGRCFKRGFKLSKWETLAQKLFYFEIQRSLILNLCHSLEVVSIVESLYDFLKYPKL